MNKLINSIKQTFINGPIGIYLMTFFIPLNPRMLGMTVAIIIVEQLIRKAKIDKTVVKSQLSLKNPGLWLLLFYLMHFVGLTYTENMSFAKLDLGMKATLGILPLFFMLYQPKINWNAFVKFFLLGAFVSIFTNVALSMDSYLQHKDIYYISGERLSHLMHRGYWAVYLIIAFYFLLKKSIVSKRRSSVLLNLLGALSVAVFVILSGAKIGFILLFVVALWAIISVFQNFKNKLILPIALIVFAIVGISTFYLSPNMTNRMEKAFSALTRPIESYDKEKPESTTARIMLWDSALELIKDNFWTGVGTGDIKDELIQKNYDKGYLGVANQKLNSHNQFFNSHVAIGVFGSLFLLMSFVANFFKHKHNSRSKWRKGISLILFSALLVEAMLETQAGIIPYAFLLSFLPIFEEFEA